MERCGGILYVYYWGKEANLKRLSDLNYMTILEGKTMKTVTRSGVVGAGWMNCGSTDDYFLIAYFLEQNWIEVI